MTYTLFISGLDDRPFDPAGFDLFPADWLAEAPGSRVTSALIRVETLTSDADVMTKADAWFVPESLALSRVIDGELIIGADFRIDPAGHMRMAIFAPARASANAASAACPATVRDRDLQIHVDARSGPCARHGARDGPDRRPTLHLLADMCGEMPAPDQTLSQLLAVSAQLENIIARSSFRFGATGAYETSSHQRIEALREVRFEGRQTFSEFMARRYDPAMRTVQSTERRLQAMSDRAIRAGDLLRTRVDVERSAQNQKLLASMDQRADMQLRLQRTVEGLSVVAISYYALNLVLYVLKPLGHRFHVDDAILAAGAAP